MPASTHELKDKSRYNIKIELCFSSMISVTLDECNFNIIFITDWFGYSTTLLRINPVASCTRPSQWLWRAIHILDIFCTIAAFTIFNGFLVLPADSLTHTDTTVDAIHTAHTSEHHTCKITQTWNETIIIIYLSPSLFFL